jgi:hypothetical protein
VNETHYRIKIWGLAFRTEPGIVSIFFPGLCMSHGYRFGLKTIAIVQRQGRSSLITTCYFVKRNFVEFDREESSETSASAQSNRKIIAKQKNKSLMMRMSDE